MKHRAFAAALLACLFAAGPSRAGSVLMISVDGLRPGDIIEAQQRGLKVPVLRGLMENGAYATGVHNVLPTVTYPNHTTLITGVWPQVHGITDNTVFDPLKKNSDGWYWYSVDIKVPTLWDVMHAAHRPVASMGWPVSVGTMSIDYNIPEYWRTFTPDDVKLQAALSTPGLPAELAAASGVTLKDAFGEEPANDVARARLAGALIAHKKPEFMTLHLASVDGKQHAFGPGSKEAHEAIEATDGAVGKLVAEARAAEPDLVVAIVSDHGFAPVEHDVNLISAFVAAGLITVDPVSHKITAWKAEPWDSGGSSAIMLANPDDAALQAKVAALLRKLAADPANGINEVIDRKGIAALGGGVEPSFWVDYKIGYEAGHKLDGALVTPGSIKGTHGYFPTHPEMRATFIINGPGIAKSGSLGEIDMRDIAPTVAKILGVSLPSATGKPLF